MSAKLHSGSRVTLRRREKKRERCYRETVTRQRITSTKHFKNNLHFRGEIQSVSQFLKELPLLRRLLDAASEG